MESIGEMINKMDGKAREYVRSELESGGAISKKFVTQIAAGELWEFNFSENLRHDRERNPRLGGEFNGDGVEEAWAQYAKFLLDFISSGSDRLLLFEDQWRKIGDPSIESEEAIFKSGETLYYYLPFGVTRTTLKAVEDNMTLASAYPRIIFAVEGVSFSNRQSRFEVDRSVLENIQTGICHAVIGAYDGESFIVWSREK